MYFFYFVNVITRKSKITYVAHIYIAFRKHYFKVFFKHSSQSNPHEMSALQLSGPNPLKVSQLNGGKASFSIGLQGPAWSYPFIPIPPAL